MSNKPLERVLGDLTYFDKKIELVDFWEIYLFCLIDHFSKYIKCYLSENKQSITVLEKFKWFNKYIGKPEIFHSDKDGEFCLTILLFYNWNKLN